MNEKMVDHMQGMGRLLYILSRPSFHVGAIRNILQRFLGGLEFDIYNPCGEGKDKKNVVFLPGYTCDIVPYQGLVGELAKTSNVYTPDNLPRGTRAAFSRLGIEDQAKRTLRYLDKFERIDKTGKPMNLVGHSMGGLVALLALKISNETYQNRHRIEKIITMGSALKPSRANHFAFLPGISQWSQAVRDLRYDSPLYPAIDPYYDRVTLSLVSRRDELYPPELMFTDEKRAKFYECGHNDFYQGKQMKVTAADIEKALSDDSADKSNKT